MREFLRKRKENKETIKKKKEEDIKKWLREVEQDKTLRTFWKGKGTNKKRIKISGEINKESWTKFFKNQFIKRDDVEKKII